MINLRKANLSDFEQYINLRKQDILEYSKIIGEKIPLAQEKQIKKEFEGMLKSKAHIILVVEKDNFLIGYLTGSIIKNVWQHSGYVDDVFVKSDFKKKGVGRHLIEGFIKFLKDNKIRKCRLGVNVKNENAINLYKKLGFKIYSYEMDKEI